MYQETASLLSKKIDCFRDQDRRIFATSSFQTQSVPLLHLLSELKQKIPIVFLNTGFLFSETYSFKDHLVRILNLEVIELKSSTSKHLQKDDNGLFHYSSDTDYCCYLNKVLPLNKWIKEGDVWISGVRRDQSAVREEMNQIEHIENNVTQFHPMLEWTAKDIYDHINKFHLPKHPLEDKGYSSIGCVPCTSISKDLDTERNGRWQGQQKTECGLHTEF